MRPLNRLHGRDLMTPLEKFLHDVDEIHSSRAAVDETPYYGALEGLFNEVGKSLKPRVRCIIHIKNKGAGLPDGGLFTAEQFDKKSGQQPKEGQLPSRGAIEVKPPAEDAGEVANSEQVTRYLSRYQQVLVTNLRQFLLVGLDQDGNPAILEPYKLAEDEKSFWKAAAHPRKTDELHGVRLTEYLKRVMLHAAPLASPEDVAFFLASYAREALARIEGLELDALAGVRGALEEALGLKFEGKKGEHFFHSSLVQTLFYGVFSAWVLWARTQPAKSKHQFDWNDTARLLKVPIIRKLFYEMAEPGALEKLNLTEVLDWTATVLNRVDRAQFFSKFQESAAVQYFYEPFLEEFDPELRKELGVWYTPHEIVKYMVERVDTVLREELNLPDGLADKNVYVLDPCCGTGSYLVEVLKKIHETLKQRGGDALIAADLKETASKRVFGFELLPAPFVVSHLQLGLLLQTLGAPLAANGKERIGVYLTNALTGWEPPKGPKKRLLFSELEEERDAAEHVKRDTPILVILGNPPYNAFAGVSPEEEQGLVEPYKEGLKDWGITKNYLDDLYVRFFRVAERRVAEMTGRGVICYISNFSYLNDPSFVVLRKRFLDEFDSLWFDCMNGDSRETGKLTPEGQPDPSVFSTQYNRAGIRLGTAIGLFVRKRGSSSAPLTKVNFRQFWGVSKKGELLSSLAALPFGADYETPTPESSNRFSFQPNTASKAYLAWPKMTDLAAVKPMLGLNENRAGALQDLDRSRLDARMQNYFNQKLEWPDLVALDSGLTRPAAGFEPQSVRKKVMSVEPYNTDRIVPYLRRPFEVGWAYVSEVSPLWNRSRPELRQALKSNPFALLTRPAQAASPEGCPIYATSLLGEQDLLRGHAYYFPISVIEKKTKKGRPSHAGQGHLLERDSQSEGRVPNLSPSALLYLHKIKAKLPKRPLQAAEPLWLHCVAVGYAPKYQSENTDGIRQDWPRIPLPNSREALITSAELGHQIASLLDTKSAIRDVTAGNLRPELKSIAIASRAGGGNLKESELALTAGWGHAGKGGVTMPGKGKSLERDYSGAERKALLDGAKALGLSEKQLFDHLGETTCDIYLNGTAYWSNIPERLWDYTIGGYQVIKKWLSYREEPLLGRALTKEEVRYVQEMARRIAAILLLEPALDENYRSVKANTFPWPPKG